MLAKLASTLDRPVTGWATENRHGVDFWNHGTGIVLGHPPGKQYRFIPGAAIPAGATRI